MKRIAQFLLLLTLAGCSASHVDEIKANAAATWGKAGYEIIGYEGYEWTGLGRWGGCVWYIVRRVPDNGVTYHGCLTKWTDGYHIYSLSAIDAFRPNQL